MLTNRQSETAGLQFHVVYYKPTTFHVKHLHAGAIAIDKDEDFTIADDDVGFLDIRSAGSNGLDFPAQQANAGLELLFDEIVVKCFLVGDNAHVAYSRSGCAGC